LATAALARTAWLTATTARTPAGARGARGNATRGVADQFSVGCSKGEQSYEHYQGDHGHEQRILRNVIPGLLAPKTLQCRHHGRTFNCELRLCLSYFKDLAVFYTAFSPKAQPDAARNRSEIAMFRATFSRGIATYRKSRRSVRERL
jgi:hypothetical protein